MPVEFLSDEADKEKLRRHFRFAVASAKLAAAIGVLDAIGGADW